MKKAVSISFVLIILLAGLHITISTHYCGGEIAASKVSLSGRSASCGMEGDGKTCPLPWHHLTRHCCEDQLKILGTVNIFTIPLSVLEDHYQKISFLQNTHLFYSSYSLKPSYTDYNPPGTCLPDQVSPEKICVFRI